MVKFLFTKSLGAACIGIGIAVPALSSALGDLLSRLAGLQAQFTANLAPPPDPLQLATALLASAAETALSIAQIVASVPLSAIQANVSLQGDIAALLAVKTALESAYNVLSAAASAGGVHVFLVDSTAAAVGSELSSAVAGSPIGSARVYGVTLLVTSPATFDTMRTVFALV